jgi:hypothetical protein
VNADEQSAVISDALQDFGFKVRSYGSTLKVYKGRNLCAIIRFLDDGKVKIEIEHDCGNEVEPVFNKLGLGKYVAKAVRTISWQGTQFIEPKLSDIHNRLAHTIVAYKQRIGKAEGMWAVNLNDAREDIQKAKDLYEWLSAQKPPASVRRWTESKLHHLEHLIKEATEALAELKVLVKKEYRG